jgi:hypothetical protein
MLGRFASFSRICLRSNPLGRNLSMLPPFAHKKWNALEINDLNIISGISVTNSPQTNAEVSALYKNLCNLLTKNTPPFSRTTRELGEFGLAYHLEKNNLLKIYESYWRCKINDKLDEIGCMEKITNEKEKVAISAFKHVFRNLLQ